MVDYSLGCSLASPLSWRRASESADVKVLWVDARSVIHAQVAGPVSITDTVEQNTYRDSQ